MSSSVMVIGDGWAALGAVAFLAHKGAQEGIQITWVAGSGTRLISPLPTLEAGQVAGANLRAAEVCKELALFYGMETGEAQSGSYLREYRNKSFREPAWTKAPTAEDRQAVMEENLWAPERRFVPCFETRFNTTLFEVETHLRNALSGDALSGENAPNIKRIEEVPVTSIEVESGKVVSVTLGSGEKIACERVIFADRWNTLSQIAGLPKGTSFARKREPMSVLQAVFAHETPVGAGLQEGFFGALHREAGEEVDKHIWGYFSSDGTRSVWSLALTGDEVEDNHLIGKKLRRMKSALDKMFTGEGWLPSGKTEFMANVKSEQVRFEEAALFVGGDPVVEPVTLPRIQGLSFLTDGYGPSCAFHQLGSEFGLWAEIDARQAQSQGESVNPADTATL